MFLSDPKRISKNGCAVLSKWADYENLLAYVETKKIKESDILIILLNVNHSANCLRRFLAHRGVFFVEITYRSVTRSPLVQRYKVGKERRIALSQAPTLMISQLNVLKRVYRCLRGVYHLLWISRQVRRIRVNCFFGVTDPWPIKLAILGKVMPATARIDLIDGGYSTVSMDVIRRFQSNRALFLQTVLNDAHRGSFWISGTIIKRSQLGDFYTRYDSRSSQYIRVLVTDDLRANLNPNAIGILSNNEGGSTIEAIIKIIDRENKSDIIIYPHPRDDIKYFNLFAKERKNITVEKSRRPIELILREAIASGYSIPAKFYLGQSSARPFLQRIYGLEVQSLILTR